MVPRNGPFNLDLGQNGVIELHVLQQLLLNQFIAKFFVPLTVNRAMTSATCGEDPSSEITTGIAYAAPLELPGWCFDTAARVLVRYSGLMHTISSQRCGRCAAVGGRRGRSF